MPRLAHAPLCFLLLIACSLAWVGTCLGQVVNIERQRLDERKPGWSGSLAANANLQRNQNSILTLASDAHVQLRRDSNVYLLVGQTGLVKTGESPDLVNYAFAHFRYTRLLTEVWGLEAFTQLQKNRVNGIASRWLIGAGPRARIVETKPVSVYLGALLMHEREREVSDAVGLRRHERLSTYLAFSYTPASADWITVATTTYVQPRLGHWADTRVSSDWSLEVKLRDNLALASTFNLLYDARPPVGLERTVYALYNGLRFSFD